MSSVTQPIDLYSLATPNGQKVAIALELLGLPYVPHTVDITKGEQHKSDFIKLNPNSKIPIIVDHIVSSDGITVTDVPIFESAAILVYLAETTQRNDVLPSPQHDLVRRAKILQWLSWQVANLGPMLGQHGMFSLWALSNPKLAGLTEEEKQVRLSFGQDVFKQESLKLLNVLEQQLQGNRFVVDSIAFSIADAAIFPYARAAVQRLGFDKLGEFPNIKRYVSDMETLDFVQRGLAVTPFPQPMVK